MANISKMKIYFSTFNNSYHYSTQTIYVAMICGINFSDAQFSASQSLHIYTTRYQQIYLNSFIENTPQETNQFIRMKSCNF